MNKKEWLRTITARIPLNFHFYPSSKNYKRFSIKNPNLGYGGLIMQSA
jgi:hypothetical protein